MQETLQKGKWKFSPIPNIEESNFNKSLERFYDMGVSGLTRENIQNSLDGRLLDYDGPVVLKIETGSLNKRDIPGIEEVHDRITHLEGRNTYTNETINHMKNIINQNEVRYISFEDINTRGLTGARNGQSGAKKDTWGIYAYNKGVHFEEDEAAVEVSRGGSHGVGKIASNAASDLHVMYFANCDADGDQHLGGTVQLIEHVHDNQAFRSTGYFTDIDFLQGNKSKFYPYENTFHEAFKKDTRGLKIVIPYFREEYDNEREIIRSICDSFFISILKNKLEVHVNGKVVNQASIVDYVKDPYYYNQDVTEAKKEFTPLYLDTYTNAEPQKIVVSNAEQDFKFQLYFRYDEQIPKGRVAVVRTIGMKIEDFKVKANATKPFNAVLVGGPEEDAYLKSLENESHTELSKDHFSDARLKRLATRFINNLSKEVAKVIDKAVQDNNPTDGMMDTKDLLFVVETQFKKDLESSMGTVKINQGQSLVKSSTTPSSKEKRDKANGKKNESKEKRSKKREPLKRQKKDAETSGTEDQKERFSAHPEMVERILVGDREMLQFDFSKSDEISGADSCDIALSIIDGMGVEYKDEFRVHNNYADIVDMHNGSSCTYSKNVIKGVQINNGTAQLQLNLRDGYNRSLKFVYYVEV